MPVQIRGTVLTLRRVDAYHALTLVAPAIATRFRPGQFVTIAVGGPQTSMLGRRAFAVHDVRPDHGGPGGRGPAGRGGTARPALPGAARPDELPAARRRLRQRAAVRARRAAEGPRLPGRLPA